MSVNEIHIFLEDKSIYICIFEHIGVANGKRNDAAKRYYEWFLYEYFLDHIRMPIRWPYQQKILKLILEPKILGRISKTNIGKPN